MNNSLYIIWSDNNNLGIPIIDEQHRAIISTINTLHYFTVNNMEKEVLDSTIVILNEYTKYHFLLEEEIIKSENYNKFNEHKKLHQQLAIETQKISSNVQKEQDPSELLKFLKNWWLNHICVEDRKYATFILGKK